MAAKVSVDVTLAHTEQDSPLEKSSLRVLDSSNKPRPSALIDFSLWNDYGCLSLSEKSEVCGRRFAQLPRHFGR